MSRAIAYPILAVIALALVAVANVAVYQAGMEWFVVRPSWLVVARNIGATGAILIGGWLLLPAERRTRNAETMLIVAAVLFGIGGAVQFRLGYDAPRQLANDQITAVRDSVRSVHPDMPAVEIGRITSRLVRARNGQLRRDFEASRIDTRLARSLEAAYGPTAETRQILDGRGTSGGDGLLFRLLPVLAALLAVALMARTDLPTLLSAQWRGAGFIGSLVVCLVTLVYLMMSGGVRGANFAPQEILKLTLPVAWAGLLIHYRSAFLSAGRERFARSPIMLWLWTLALLSSPLVVFLLVRDFGQFLVISIAQTLLLAWFTRSALYVVLFVAGTLASTALLIGGALFPAGSILTVLAIVVAAVVVIGALERFRRRDALWTSASMVLGVYVAIAWLAVQLPFVTRILATPRSRFLLWADLFTRRGNAAWWDSSRQIVESLYAFDAGGAVGHGLGYGTPFLIPKAASDFIFASIAEEMGIAGAVLVILSFAVLLVLGLRIAARIGRDSFPGLLVAGYSLLLAAQAFVHIAGTMNVLPMTGITLPLVSSGMSSLVVSWAVVGIILALSSRDPNAAQRMVVVERKNAEL